MVRSLKEFNEAYEAQLKQFDERVDECLHILQGAAQSSLVAQRRLAAFLKSSVMIREMMQQNHKSTVSTVNSLLGKTDQGTAAIRAATNRIDAARGHPVASSQKLQETIVSAVDGVGESIMDESLAVTQKIMDEHFAEYR